MRGRGPPPRRGPRARAPWTRAQLLQPGSVEPQSCVCPDRKRLNSSGNRPDLSCAKSGGDLSCANSGGDLSGANSGGDLSCASSGGDLSGASSGGDLSCAKSGGDHSGATSGGDCCASCRPEPRRRSSRAAGLSPDRCELQAPSLELPREGWGNAPGELPAAERGGIHALGDAEWIDPTTRLSVNQIKGRRIPY